MEVEVTVSQPQPAPPQPDPASLNNQISGTSTPIPAQPPATSHWMATDAHGQSLDDSGAVDPDVSDYGTTMLAAVVKTADPTHTASGDVSMAASAANIAADGPAAATDRELGCKKDPAVWHVVLATLKCQLSDFIAKKNAAERRIASIDDTMEEFARRAETASADKKATEAALQQAS